MQISVPDTVPETSEDAPARRNTMVDGAEANVSRQEPPSAAQLVEDLSRNLADFSQRVSSRMSVVFSAPVSPASHRSRAEHSNRAEEAVATAAERVTEPLPVVTVAEEEEEEEPVVAIAAVSVSPSASASPPKRMVLKAVAEEDDDDQPAIGRGRRGRDHARGSIMHRESTTYLPVTAVTRIHQEGAVRATVVTQDEDENARRDSLVA